MPIRLVTPTNAPGTPKLVGDYYVINQRSYVRASNVVDILAPEDHLLEMIEQRGWDWWHEAGQAAAFGTAVHAECEKMNLLAMRHTEVPPYTWMGSSIPAPAQRPKKWHETLSPNNPLAWPRYEISDGNDRQVWVPTPNGTERVTFREQCPTTGSPLLGSVRAYTNWLFTDVEQVIMAEQTVWSEKYGFAGTFDALVLLRGGLVAIVDIKTSKRLSWPYRLQTAAYVQALKETFGILADCRLILQIPSDRGGSRWRPIEYGGFHQQADFTTFWGLLRGYRYRHEYKHDWKI